MAHMNDRPRTWNWPLTVTVVALAFVGAGVYVFQSLRRAPGEVVDAGREVLSDLKDIAKAFNTGTATTSFKSYATRVSGNQFLQFATLDQVEVFERQDSATTLWGQLALPDVVVQATAPVQYTYYLDLNGNWKLELEDGMVRVLAPAVRFNKPSVDASQIHYQVRTGSFFRDEDEAVAKLQEGISALAHRKAQENITLVRELGRKQTEEFVRNWMLERFGEPSARYRVEVLFADERSPLDLPGKIGPLEPDEGAGARLEPAPSVDSRRREE